LSNNHTERARVFGSDARFNGKALKLPPSSFSRAGTTARSGVARGSRSAGALATVTLGPRQLLSRRHQRCKAGTSMVDSAIRMLRVSLPDRVLEAALAALSGFNPANLFPRA
jgi:hypothetical protein